MAEELTLEDIRPMELPPLPDNPLVSVLIANYNYAQYIGEAIESVLNQTYQNFEIVICDDGSTDNSLEVIRNYAQRDSRIKYIAKENGGVASALNAAYSESKGEIICLLDADDVFMPNKVFSVVSQFREFDQIGIVMHQLQRIDPSGSLISIPFPSRVECGWQAVNALRQGGVIEQSPASGLSLRRNVAERIFPLPPIQALADAYIVGAAAFITNIHFIENVLAYQRVHGSNITGGRVLNLERIRKTSKDYEVVIAALENFINNIEINAHLNPADRPGYWDSKLAEALLGYDELPHEALTQISVARRYVWRLLFLLPRSLSVFVLRAWWRDSRTKYLIKLFLERVNWLTNKSKAKIPL